MGKQAKSTSCPEDKIDSGVHAQKHITNVMKMQQRGLAKGSTVFCLCGLMPS